MKVRNLNLYTLRYLPLIDVFDTSDIRSFSRGLAGALYDYIRPSVRYFYRDSVLNTYMIFASGPFYAVQDEIDRLSNIKHYGRSGPLLALIEGVPAEMPIQDREATDYISRRWGLLYDFPRADDVADN